MRTLSWDDSCLLPRPGSSSQPLDMVQFPQSYSERSSDTLQTPLLAWLTSAPSPAPSAGGKWAQGPAIAHGGAPFPPGPWFHLAPSCLPQAAAGSAEHRTQVRAAEKQRGLITALDQMPPSQRLRAGSAPRRRRPSLPSFCSTSLHTSDLPSAFPSGWKASAKTHCSLSGDRKGDHSSSMSFDQQQQLPEPPSKRPLTSLAGTGSHAHHPP